MKQVLLYFFIIISMAVFSCEEAGREKIKTTAIADTTKADTAEYDSFGFRVDTMEVESHRVKKNESLYLILDKYDFSPQEIYSITEKAGEVIDYRSIKPGQQYYTYSGKTSDSISRLVWQPSALEYVVFDLRDTLNIYRSQKNITKKISSANAVIKKSLYETMQAEEMSPLLAYKLSDIYAWEIDFFSLRDGDWFRVVYEENYVDGDFYGIGSILAVEFNHRGESYFAYKFEDDSISGYFDEQGNSIQKALLKAPFKYGQRISSGFSHSRFHPVLKRRIPHYGVDYAAPYGTPVLSVGDGTVIEARHRGASGNIVKIRHNGTYKTAYLHLKGFARGIKYGAEVEQGQVIGYVGNTGRVTGTHLDYRIYKNDRPVNPLRIDLPASESVPEESMDTFMRVKEHWDHRLKLAERPEPAS